MMERTTTPPGRFITEWHVTRTLCTGCRKTGGVAYRAWKGDYVGFENFQYRCSGCGHEWWIDGTDA